MSFILVEVVLALCKELLLCEIVEFLITQAECTLNLSYLLSKIIIFLFD